MEPAAVLHGRAARRARAALDRPGHGPDRPAGQRRPCAAPRTTPSLARQAVHTIPRRPHGLRRPAGRRLPRRPRLDLRPRRPAPVPERCTCIPEPPPPGSTALQGLNVHTIAIQVPRATSPATATTPPTSWTRGSVIGVWATASRASARGVRRRDRRTRRPTAALDAGLAARQPALQRGARADGGRRTTGTRQAPTGDQQFAQYVHHAGARRACCPSSTRASSRTSRRTRKPRADLAAILLTGIPAGVVPGFQNYTGPTQADMLRLNIAVPPTPSPNPLGLIGRRRGRLPERPTDRRRRRHHRAAGRRGRDDPAGRPVVQAGRRATSVVTDGTTNTNLPTLSVFPYLGHPASGSESMPGTPAA